MLRVTAVVLASLTSAGACMGFKKHVLAQETEEKVWTFSTNANRRPQYYLDESGNVAGFGVDIVNAVCKNAGKKCQFQVDAFQQCVTNNEDGSFRPGNGLVEGKFDACPGYVISADREKLCAFTAPFLATSAHFCVKEGNPANFDPTNLDGKKITHLEGAYTNEACLQQLGMNGAQFLIAKGIDEAVENVKTGKADAIFSPRTRIPGLDAVPGSYNCGEGVAVMVMPDSTLPEWWNPAFQQLVDSGEYADICEQSVSRHGGPPVKRVQFAAAKTGEVKIEAEKVEIRKVVEEKIEETKKVAEEAACDIKQVVEEKLEEPKKVVEEKIAEIKEVVQDKLEEPKKVVGEKVAEIKEVVGDTLEATKQVIEEKIDE